VISLCDDPLSLRLLREATNKAINKGNWLLVNYSKPSQATASAVTDIFAAMTGPGVNTNFRFIVIATSLEFLSVSMISQSKRVHVEDFPAIRNSMLSYFHHHSTAIRSTTNVKAMKKLSYLCAFLMSVQGFRGFIEPVGFSTEVGIDALTFVDVIAELSVIIDANPNDLCIKNLRNQLETLIYAGVNDQVDRRRLAADISALTSLDAQEEGWSIVPDSDESEKWQLPGDDPMVQITQLISDLPLFPSTDIIRMKCPRLLTWNLSLWIAQPFLKYENYKAPFDPANLATKI
jgi:hypothetical protein